MNCSFPSCSNEAILWGICDEHYRNIAGDIAVRYSQLCKEKGRKPTFGELIENVDWGKDRDKTVNWDSDMDTVVIPADKNAQGDGI